MTDNYNGNRGVNAAAEGRLGGVMSAAAAGVMNLGGSSIFTRVVVEEVIFDPTLIDEDRAKYYEQEFKLRDISFLRSLPPNTIIGRPVRGSTSTAADESQYFFPMFPPHFMLPIKAGEHVWVFFEENKTNHFGYWLFRITEPRDVDDLNQTHHDRKFHLEQKKGTKDKFERTGDEETPGFDNGPTIKSGGDKQASASGASYNGGEKAYEKLIKESDAGKVHDLEDVPRFKKRPGDLAVQGSNNTLIVLGTDRTGPATDVESTPKGKRAKGKPEADKSGHAGAIDIVVGRGQKDKTKPKKVAKNSLGKDEVIKNVEKESSSEGDPDFESDSARFYLSMKTDVDKNFNIKLKGLPPENVGDGAPAAIIKVDHMRIVVRETLKLLVQPSFDSPESDCAGVMIKKDGNIVFVPAEKGVLKLGGEDANIALIGIEMEAGATNANGKVTAPGLVCTMGGIAGKGGAHGVFCTKILGK